MAILFSGIVIKKLKKRSDHQTEDSTSEIAHVNDSLEDKKLESSF
jgi:hypothetical protein